MIVNAIMPEWNGVPSGQKIHWPLPDYIGDRTKLQVAKGIVREPQMTMLLGRTMSALVMTLILGASSAVGLREANERATRPLLPPSAVFALDPLEQADQSGSLDCAKFKRLAQSAELQVLAVQFAHQAESPDYQSPDYVDQMTALQSATVQLQSATFADRTIEQLRQDYVQLLEPVVQAARHRPPGAIADLASSVTQFNREQIIFKQCAA